MKRTPKRVHNPQLPCERKRHFATEELALQAAEVRMGEHLSLHLGAYQCPACYLWHLTRITDDLRNR